MLFFFSTDGSCDYELRQNQKQLLGYLMSDAWPCEVTGAAVSPESSESVKQVHKRVAVSHVPMSTLRRCSRNLEALSLQLPAQRDARGLSSLSLCFYYDETADRERESRQEGENKEKLIAKWKLRLLYKFHSNKCSERRVRLWFTVEMKTTNWNDTDMKHDKLKLSQYSFIYIYTYKYIYISKYIFINIYMYECIYI